ncbi:MAG: F0F1 ATP synthase subunit A [Pseudomonadota bacterium]|jgi:F-type H+-transporting ATPase subunit a|nr:MAG: F0F1 ATP synthase subunit A [Pseudomonadota bacterium]
MHQFEINRLAEIEIFGIDASFTNSSLFMVLGVALITGFFALAMNGRSLVPTRMQSVAELCYEFVANMVRENVGQAGMKYFPFVFTLFTYILVMNLLGMIPYSFTVTSHIIVTFALAALVFVVVTAIGFARHGLGYLKLFVPEGVPIWLMPLIVPIELISYLIRPISLSVRLFANMMAGHTMLKVFAGFVVSLGIFGFAPLLFTVAFTGLEFVVAFLQAFIFAVLTCIYLNDAVNMHH